MVSMGEACKEVREESERQLHAVCSMVEDIAQIVNKTELTLGSKVPLIDHFYKNMSQCNLRVDEHETKVKQ